MKICFTGRISIPRAQAHKLAQDGGFEPIDYVTKVLDYLVVGKDPGSKLPKATLLGVNILSEAQFFDLLKQPKDEEPPLTPKQLTEIFSHLVTLSCAWCGGTYKQWDTLPNRETCHICAFRNKPPTCSNCHLPTIYVETLNLYHCTLCGTWRKAPYSIHITWKTKHLHLFIPRTKNQKQCPCGYTITLTNQQIQEQQDLYARAPQLVEDWREKNEAYQQILDELEKERIWKGWFKSLTPEQVNQIANQPKEAE